MLRAVGIALVALLCVSCASEKKQPSPEAPPVSSLPVKHAGEPVHKPIAHNTLLARRQQLLVQARQKGMRVRLTLQTPDGRNAVSLRSNERINAASMAKLVPAACALRAGHMPPTERVLLSRMLRYSDNQAADAISLTVPLRSCAVKLAHRAQLQDTVPGAGRWGIAGMSTRDGAALAGELKSFTRASYPQLIHELSHVVEGQNWGSAELPSSVTLYAKPGFLPADMTGGRGAQAGQIGLLVVRDGHCQGTWRWSVLVDHAPSVRHASWRISQLVKRATQVALAYDCSSQSNARSSTSG